MAGNDLVTKAPQAGAIARQEFGAQQVQVVPETAATAAAAHARAQVEAGYVMAERHPRDLMRVREKLVADCQRKNFALVAKYKLPRGGKDIKGPSIRFAEAAKAAMGNIGVDTAVIHEDAERRIVKVMAIDFENNSVEGDTCVIDKTIERKAPKPGEVVIRKRINSENQEVSVIIATESEIQFKQQSQVSRIRRNLILRFLPGDIKDDALETVDKTNAGEHQNNKAESLKVIVDGLGRLGISVQQIAQYLGHAVDQMTFEEWDELKDLGVALKDKETTWAEALEEKLATRATEKPTTEAETQEREKLVRQLATAKLEHAEAYAYALGTLSLTPAARTEALGLGQLRQVVAALQSKIGNGNGGSGAAKPAGGAS